MQCPVDGETLVMADRGGVEIDYCPKCRGVWLDRGELDKIIDRSAGPAVAMPAPAPTPMAPPMRPAALVERAVVDIWTTLKAKRLATLHLDPNIPGGVSPGRARGHGCPLFLCSHLVRGLELG